MTLVLFVCCALAGFALLYTLWVPEQEVVVPQPPTEIEHLLEKKKVIYDNLKDLNFEYRTGKLSDDDYQQLKTSLQYEVALLMSSIDELQRRDREGARPATKAPAAAPPAPSTNVCRACGSSNPPNHKHCSECGARLAALVLAFVLLFAAWPASAQKLSVEGIATNLTTGKPAAGLAVNLMRAGENMDVLDHTTADARGKFHFAAVDAPASPAMLLVRAEYQGVRYTEAVSPGTPVDLKVYDANAPASAIHVTERAVILQPSQGQLAVNELYVVKNDSNPPAAYSPSGGSFHFFVAKGGEKTLEAVTQGAGGMSLPLETAPDPTRPGVMSVKQALKPGENHIEVIYHLEYPGSAVLESQAVDKVERTRLAVTQGVNVEGQGITFMATEPQTKFGIYDVADNDHWSVKLSGEGQPAPAVGAGNEGGDSQNDVQSLPNLIGRNLYYLLAAMMAVLAIGFARLWQAKV